MMKSREGYQNKTLLSVFIALIVAACLALTGIGTALGAPDSSSTQTSNRIENVNNERQDMGVYLTYEITEKSLIGHYDGDVEDIHPYLSFYIYDTYEIAGADYYLDYYFNDASNAIFTSNPYINNDNNFVVDISTLAPGTYYVFGTDGLVEAPLVTFSISDSTPQPTSPVAFTLNFKATGIQSTGFANYKEAFAALNGTN